MRLFALVAAMLAAFTTAHAQTEAAHVYKLGDVIPESTTFADYQGKTRTLGEFRGKPLVLEWTNYGCPFVQKHYTSGNMQKLQAAYTARGVAWVSVISSAPGKQGYYATADAPAAAAKMTFKGTTVALDPTGKLGRAFGAETSPHIFIITADGKLAYRGAIDSVPSFSTDDIAGATNYAAQALDEIAAGKPVTIAQTNPYGCSIKY
jgi:hypothetical protein